MISVKDNFGNVIQAPVFYGWEAMPRDVPIHPFDRIVTPYKTYGRTPFTSVTVPVRFHNKTLNELYGNQYVLYRPQVLTYNSRKSPDQWYTLVDPFQELQAGDVWCYSGCLNPEDRTGNMETVLGLAGHPLEHLFKNYSNVTVWRKGKPPAGGIQRSFRLRGNPVYAAPLPLP